MRSLLASDWRVMGAFSKLRAIYGKWAWLAGWWLAIDGGVLNITAAAWSAGFQWWRSGDTTRTQNVSEYMLVLALYLVVVVVPSGRGPAYTGPICANPGGRSLVNDVCKCVRD